MAEYKTEVRDNMRIDWDVPIIMDDGIVLRADVFRPVAEGKYPALVSYGPYGKGLAFQDGYKTAWEIMEREFPDTVAGKASVREPKSTFQLQRAGGIVRGNGQQSGSPLRTS